MKIKKRKNQNMKKLPLKTFLSIFNKSIQSETGWLFLAKSEATFGHIRQDKTEILKRITSGKFRADGLSESSIERLNEEAEKMFFQKIFEVMNKIFLRFEDLQRIFIGSRDPIEEKIVKNDILDHRLKGKMKFIVVSSEKEEEGIRIFLKKIENILTKKF